ncbi:MAG: YraN family protein [Armatimonadetes bacterium]|nr:YraN family protein [Armatimonadota bacterium]
MLQRRGYRIVARNWRCRLGEIDLVAEEGGDLVVVEVKARLSDDFGGPEAAVNVAKQRKLSRLLDCLLLGRETVNCRFDVVALVLDPRGRIRRAEVYQHAFRYHPR